MTISIAPLTHAPSTAVEALLDAAFGADRRQRTAYRIRAGTEAEAALSFGAFDAGVLVGSLQSWPVAVGPVPLVLVGPVAVAPERQGLGLGSALMERLIAAAGAPESSMPMTMIGDPDYYARWGFSSAATGGWQVPGPVERHRLLARAAAGLPRVGMLGPRGFALADAAE